MVLGVLCLIYIVGLRGYVDFVGIYYGFPIKSAYYTNVSD